MSDLIEANLLIAPQYLAIIRDWLFVSNYVIVFHRDICLITCLIFLRGKKTERKGKNNTLVTLITPACFLVL